jgi:2-polyprenyl-3-methyl-5-hydroxy-6-metoxy-1,4-benzoquinol methylase
VQTCKYDTMVDAGAENTSHVQMLQLVGGGKRVLDVGCATGYLARALVEQGCTVWGVEYDAQAAEQARSALADVLVGDLETLDLVGYFGVGRFDVVIFGDVLEHLRRPLDVLREARPLLVPGGCVVLSIPNIAHGSVRLALLRGEWRYRPLGLLDDTHLRFFTRDTVEELLRAAGLVPVDVRRTTAGLFDTELGIRPGDFPPELVQRVLDDPEATTYQFVVRAVVEGADSAVRELHEREEAAWREVHQLSGQIAELRGEVERLYRELTALHATRTLRSTRRARALCSLLRSPLRHAVVGERSARPASRP